MSRLDDLLYGNSDDTVGNSGSLWNNSGNENYSPYGGQQLGSISLDDLINREDWGAYNNNYNASGGANGDGSGIRYDDLINREGWGPYNNYNASGGANGDGSAPGGDFLSTISGLANSVLDLFSKDSGLSRLIGGFLTNPYAAAALSAYYAKTKNENTREASQAIHDQYLADKADFDAKLGGLKDRNTLYGAPIAVVDQRLAVDPVKRNGASEWYANNKLPSWSVDGLPASTAQVTPYVTPYEAVPGGGGFADTGKIFSAAGGGLARASHFVKGSGGGTADNVPASLSDGEYVIDADVVSALGDGNNDAGAQKLDQMRINIRRHKRATPTTAIPPKAKSVKLYLRG